MGGKRHLPRLVIVLGLVAAVAAGCRSRPVHGHVHGDAESRTITNRVDADRHHSANGHQRGCR